MSDIPADAQALPDEPVGVLEMVGVLLGMHDGKAFVSDKALRLVLPGEIKVWRDEVKGGYWLAITREGDGE